MSSYGAGVHLLPNPTENPCMQFSCSQSCFSLIQFSMRQDLCSTIDSEGETVCGISYFALVVYIFGNHTLGVLGIMVHIQLHLVSFKWPACREGI